MSYESVYVAMSSVRKSSDIRLLVHGDTWQERVGALSYLSALRPNKKVAAFFAGFGKSSSSGYGPFEWKPELALYVYSMSSPRW